jgi:putative RNA 2'-phosphotransferase
MINYRDLSRTVSQALRHDPGRYGLIVDAQGWVAVSDLITALGREHVQWHSLTEADLKKMILHSDKMRHEINGMRIRALYGHSIQRTLEREPSRPPNILFHGTDTDAAEIILVQGLSPMARQHVHLSVDKKTAKQVGLRKSSKPVILQIAAGSAHQHGTRFYKGNDLVWLADYVPPTFITLLAEKSSPADDMMR